MRSGIAPLRRPHTPLQMAADLLNVGHEHLLGAGALVARRTQHGSWMHCRERRRRPRIVDRGSAHLHHTERPAQQSLCGDRTQADDDVGLHQGDFVLEPWEAGSDLAGVRRFVDAAFRARILRPLEMLHRVRDVDVVTVDPGNIERAVEQLA